METNDPRKGGAYARQAVLEDVLRIAARGRGARFQALVGLQPSLEKPSVRGCRFLLDLFQPPAQRLEPD